MRRRVGAIAKFKAQRKAIQKARNAAPVVRAPEFFVTRAADGTWQVWTSAGRRPLQSIPAQCRAGGFETREEAQAWIDDEN